MTFFIFIEYSDLYNFADDKTLSYESSDTNYRTRKPGAC